MPKESPGDKPIDPLIVRYLIRPSSNRIAKFLLNTRVTPNHLTTLSLFFSLVAAIFFSFGEYIFLVMGVILFQIGYFIFDNVDGSLARLRGHSSEFGAWYDDIDDRIREVATFLGLTIGLYRMNGEFNVIIIGMVATINILMVNYLRATTYKFSKKLMPEIMLKENLYLGWTETIVLLTTIFVVINQVYWLLLFYAVVGTLAWLIKMYSIYNKHKKGYIN